MHPRGVQLFMMRLHPALALALAVLALSAIPGLSVQGQTGETINDSEAYAVYASVVRMRFSEGDKPPTALTLLQETRAGMDCVHGCAAG